MLHQITREQVVPTQLDEVWEYFAMPKNLNEMTPPDMHFEIIHGAEGSMFQGQLIAYRVQIMPLIKSHWLTEIAHVKDKAYFVDEQRIGPYRFWYHEHRFEAFEGGTRIIDRVTYELPFGPLGDLVHAIWVGPRLKSIFDYRREKVTALFGA
jgi:ligand-binding SRPBCC domain-containing protein